MDQETRKNHSDKNVDLIVTVNDSEQYWIQHNMIKSEAEALQDLVAFNKVPEATKRKIIEESEPKTDVKKAKLDTKAKRPGFSDERFNETSYYNEK